MNGEEILRSVRLSLVSWINSHDGITCGLRPDGQIAVFIPYVDRDGQEGIDVEIIPATIQAAREVLGY